MDITLEDVQHNMMQPSTASFLPTPTSGPALSPFNLGLPTDTAANNFWTASPCNCYVLNQSFVNRIDAIVKEPATFALDTVLCSLQEVAAHIASYLDCPHCGTSCPRLMNLAMLHQRQVALMCVIAKNPSAFIGGPTSDNLHFTLGLYQLPEQNNAMFKRLVILSAARNIDQLVANFDDSIRAHQDLEFTGSVVSETESAKLNLRWLLDVSRNLKSRLKAIVCILEKPEWAAC